MVLISKSDVLAVWESFMKKGQDIDLFIRYARALRVKDESENKHEVRSFTSILKRNALYKKDNNAFFQKHHPHLLKRDTLAGQKRKMDKLLEEFGTKWERGPKKETPVKVKTQVKVIFPHTEPNSKDLEDFAILTEGEVAEKEILYPNLKNGGEWFKNWHLLAKNKPPWFENLEKIGARDSDLVTLIKDHRPKVVDEATSEEITTSVKKYEVNTFDMEMLRRYLDILTRKRGNINYLLPTTLEWKDGSKRALGKRMAELVNTTITGKSLRSNPFMDILRTEAIRGKDWFNSLLTRTRINKILSHKKIEDMIIGDIIDAWENNKEISEDFKIEIPSTDDIPTTTDKMKAYIRNKMEIGGQRISDIATVKAMEMQEEVSDTISPQTKEALELILDDEPEPPMVPMLSNEQKKKLLKRSRIKGTNLTFEERNFGTVKRYEVRSDEGVVPMHKINLLLEAIQKIKDEEIKPLLEGVKELNILHHSSNFAKVLLQHENLQEKAKTGSLQGISLSQLDVNNLVRFFHLLDEMFGEGVGEGSVIDSYRQIDAVPLEEKEKLANALEDRLGDLIDNYREGFAYAFEAKLREVLNNQGVGEGRNQVKPNIQKELVSKGIVQEA
jgi:hypothetical protein